MRKKLLRYVKFVLCSIIIFSLLIPSFATTSVDSSAFITKEEFDKTLSDFNMRLSRFEAGINSKIDSQVTSYLDRNGIWNTHSFVTTRTVVLSDTLLPTDTIKSKVCGNGVDKTKEFISLYKYNHTEPMGKQGLCILRLTGDGTAALQFYKDNVTNIEYISMQLTFPHLFIRNKNTSKELATYQIGQFFYAASSNEGNKDMVRTSCSFNTSGADIMFFVDKEDVLQLDFGLVCVWHDDSEKGWDGLASATTWDFNIYMEPTSGVY